MVSALLRAKANLQVRTSRLQESALDRALEQRRHDCVRLLTTGADPGLPGGSLLADPRKPSAPGVPPPPEGAPPGRSSTRGAGVFVFYGSQSGTAERMARDLVERFGNFGTVCQLRDLEDFDPDELNIAELAILVVATYGDGEPTDSARRFDAWLQNPLRGPGALHGLRYTVLGLGDHTYALPFEFARTTDRRLRQLGATCVYARGEADAEEDQELEFEEWVTGLWPALGSTVSCLAGLPATASTGSHLTLPKKRPFFPLEVRFLGQCSRQDDAAAGAAAASSGEEPEKTRSQLLRGESGAAKWFLSACEAVVTTDGRPRELRQGTEDSTVHLELLLPEGTTYQTADNLEVLPENEPEAITFFASRLGVWERLDEELTWEPVPGRPAGDAAADPSPKKGTSSSSWRPGFLLRRGEKVLPPTVVAPPPASTLGESGGGGHHLAVPFPVPCTLRWALTAYCDLSAVPVGSKLRALAPYLRDEAERSALDRLTGTAKGKEFFKAFVLGCRLSFREFLEIFLTSLEIPISDFLQWCPQQRPRPYTLASSHLEAPGRPALCVAVIAERVQSLAAPVLRTMLKAKRVRCSAKVADALAAKEQSPGGRVFRGLCSGFLAGLSPGQRLLVRVRGSSFRLPPPPLGGEIPRPILAIGTGAGVAPFRAWLREWPRAKREPALRLFFGCCYAKKDWLYREEMQEAQHAGNLRLVTAFSREETQGPARGKMYVQHRLREHADALWDLLYRQNAIVYVCGSKPMGLAVRQALFEICTHRSRQLGLERNFLDEVRKERRVIEELWG